MKNQCDTLLVFDLDGTLADSLPSIRDALNQTLVKFGHQQLSMDQVRPIVGYGAYILIQKAVPSATKDTHDLMFADYTPRLADVSQSVNCFQHIPELLQALRLAGKGRIKIAIASNKPQESVDAMVFNKGLDKLVDIAVGVTQSRGPKPAQDMIIYLQKLYKPSRTVVIGDTEVDWQFAQNAKAECILVGYGFRTPEELKARTNSSEIMSTVDDLKKCLLQ